MAAGRYIYKVGRRKTSIAQVRLFKGEGDNTVNGKKLEDLFTLKTEMSRIMRPFVVTETMGEYHFEADVTGGGNTGWIGAIRQGVSRALVESNDAHKAALKSAGFLTRDPRMKERKKPYTRGARRGKQFSKR